MISIKVARVMSISYKWKIIIKYAEVLSFFHFLFQFLFDRCQRCENKTDSYFQLSKASTWLQVAVSKVYWLQCITENGLSFRQPQVMIIRRILLWFPIHCRYCCSKATLGSELSQFQPTVAIMLCRAQNEDLAWSPHIWPICPF